MNKIYKIKDMLLTKEATQKYISPFFSLTPNDTIDNLRTRLSCLKDMGIDSITVNYGRGRANMERIAFDDEFFAAADRLVEVLRELDMNFWLQDAAPFPTGSVNNILRNKNYADKNKLYLDERHVDVCGPAEDAVIRINDAMHIVYGASVHSFHHIAPMERECIAVTAYKLSSEGQLKKGSAISLSRLVNNGMLHWNIPRGHWRIFISFITRESSGRPYFINLLSRESVALLTEQVHAPVYRHLKEELGKRWMGFFYDEPEVGNNGGNEIFDYHMLPGRRQHATENCDVLPWSNEMVNEMAARDKNWHDILPLLWYDGEGVEGDARYMYMDSVTSLIMKNYNGQTYEWCQNRKVGYIGHVLEDENSHGRLGCGTGHYFRIQRYQDTAGVDLIGGQLMPGCDRKNSWYGSTNADGEFYHYGLAKLASSEAHINPQKMGRSVCEVFAVYGPAASVKMRKFVLDHLLVNGINSFIYADYACYGLPIEQHHVLNNYVNKLCEVFNHTDPIIQVAVLYHADAAWCGDAMMFQRVGSVLARAQISYDIVPADIFTEPDVYNACFDTGLSVNAHKYQALVLPGAEYISESVENFIEHAGKIGFPVFCAETIPTKVCGRARAVRQAAVQAIQTTSLKELAETISRRIDRDLILSYPCPWIRYAHVKGMDGELFMLHNESQWDTYDMDIELALSGTIYEIDPFASRAVIASSKDLANGKSQLHLVMKPFETKLFYAGAAVSDMYLQEDVQYVKDISEEWTLTFINSEQIVEKKLKKLEDVRCFTGDYFSGELDYKTKTILQGRMPHALIVTDLYDTAELIINGQSVGHRICLPYIFDVKNFVKEGENVIELKVYPSSVNYTTGGDFAGISANSLNAVPYTVTGKMGVVGKVEWQYE